MLATAQTITGAKTFQAATTCATLNATALQVDGTNISQTYAPLSNPSFTGTVTTPALTVTDVLTASGSDVEAVQHLTHLRTNGPYVNHSLVYSNQ